MPQRVHVLPPVMPLTEEDARELLAKPLLAACSEHGPKRVAAALRCDEKTVRRARDELSTLRLDFAANLLTVDPLAFDPFLAHVGRRSVPAGAVCNSDHDQGRQSKVLKAALALSLALEDDGCISPKEVRDNRAAIEDARDALDQLLGKLVAVAA